jgi:hypothetical protein
VFPARANCLTHVESLSSCSKYVPETSDRFKVIVQVINFLVAKPPYKGLLKGFYRKSAPHSELILHADVRWLNAGKALSRACELLEEIKGFISSSRHYHSFPTCLK